MSHVSMILSGFMLMAMLVFFAPNIFALNRGHILRNIALWLAIFLGLALIYQNFGPNGPYPLFQLPDSMVGMDKESSSTALPTVINKDKTNKDDDTNGNGEEGFTPPKD